MSTQSEWTLRMPQSHGSVVLTHTHCTGLRSAAHTPTHCRITASWLEEEIVFSCHAAPVFFFPWNVSWFSLTLFSSGHGQHICVCYVIMLYKQNKTLHTITGPDLKMQFTIWFLFLCLFRERLLIFEFSSQSISWNGFSSRSKPPCLFPIYRARTVYEHWSFSDHKALNGQLEDHDKKCGGLESRTGPLNTAAACFF